MVLCKESIHIFPSFSPLNLVKEEIDAVVSGMENVLGSNRSMGDTSVLPAAYNAFGR